jgi:L-lactate dehydrogenase complex protein LldF
MVTSLPRTHIAVMGMERVVENWEQLDVLLALLTRAATGQAISVYVTAVTGPRRSSEVDGPDEFHLVILDNGRSEILGTEFQEILHCIRCGACLNVCPVYRQIGGHAYGWVYSGPIGAVLTPLLNQAPEAKELSGASSLCSACWEACPVKIPLQDLLLHLRTKRAPEANARERAAWKTWATAWSSPAVYRATTRLAATGARVLPESFGPKGWSQSRTRPRPAKGSSFRERFERGDI